LSESLVAVCDAYAAMSSERPYDDGITAAEALPEVAKAFCKLIELPVMPCTDAERPTL